MKQFSLVALLALFSAPAMAYVGPGLGMGVIGTIFGVLAAIVLAVFGLFWYPLKRRFGNKTPDGDAQQTRPVLAEADQTASPDAIVHTRPASPAVNVPNKQVSHHAVATDDVPDPSSSRRDDSPVQ